MEIYVLERMEILVGSGCMWVVWKFLYMGKFGRSKATEARKGKTWVYVRKFYFEA
jgi:hypothetical protein